MLAANSNTSLFIQETGKVGNSNPAPGLLMLNTRNRTDEIGVGNVQLKYRYRLQRCEVFWSRGMIIIQRRGGSRLAVSSEALGGA